MVVSDYNKLLQKPSIKVLFYKNKMAILGKEGREKISILSFADIGAGIWKYFREIFEGNILGKYFREIFWFKLGLHKLGTNECIILWLHKVGTNNCKVLVNLG